MSNKKRTKKHNATKRARRFFNNVRVWSWESSVVHNGSRLVEARAKINMVWRALGQKQLDAILTHSNNWVVTCRALCELNNDVWIETESRSAKDVKVNELGDEFERMREAVLACVNIEHVVDVGWIIQSFNAIDRIDSDVELKHLGEVSELRRLNWHHSRDIYAEVNNVAA